jgi:hypothetical protein
MVMTQAEHDMLSAIADASCRTAGDMVCALIRAEWERRSVSSATAETRVAQ